MSNAPECDGKEQFNNFQRAEEVARQQARRHDGERFAPYLCRHCGHFHVGTALKTRRPEIPVATDEEMAELDFLEMRNRRR